MGATCWRGGNVSAYRRGEEVPAYGLIRLVEWPPNAERRQVPLAWKRLVGLGYSLFAGRAKRA